MTKELHLVVDIPGVRLDKYLSEHCQLSRSYVQKLIREGQVTVNSRQAKPGLKLNVGDEVKALIPPPALSTLIPEEIPITIVYQDSDLIVVDKPAGLPVHPAPGHPRHTLVNAILALCPDLPGIGGTVRPGVVHRLDKDTSGLMIVAKNSAAHADLVNQFKARSVVKRYLVLVRGRLAPERGAIEAPIGRDPRNRKRMAVVSGGREARTLYRVVKYLDGYSLLEVAPETGRTHQIRLHLSAIGYPVMGDAVYGVKAPFLGRQFVHAHFLGFRLPGTGEYVEFKSELPPDLGEALRRVQGGEV